MNKHSEEMKEALTIGSPNAKEIEKITIKQEFEEEDVCKHTDTYNATVQPNIKNELHHEVDLSIVKDKDLIESSSNQPFEAASKVRKKKYLCLVCQKCFLSCELRRNHFMNHFMKEPVVCYCGKLFTEAFGFSKHYFVHFVKKGRGNSKIYLKPFSKKTNIRQPGIYTIEKPYKRKVFLEQFSGKEHFSQYSRTSLIRHSVVHTREKPFTCEICLKVFSLSSNLTKHSRICSKQFSDTSTFSPKSSSSNRPHKKRHQCKICLKQFFYRSQLVNHSRIHTGEKPYKCKICLKQFAQSSNLIMHSKIHKRMTPYKCEICLKEFSKSSHLNSHYTKHTGENLKLKIKANFSKLIK